MEGTQAPKGEFYSLRWTNYLSNLAETVFNHQNLEKLIDVTLVCEGQFIRAHKLILSSCSGFFQEMFKPGTGIADISGLNGSLIHPVIVMNGIKHNHLKHIVDFIYRGEIRVLDTDLEGVLALGESMQIKGLCSVKLRQKSGQNENTSELSSQNLRSDNLKVDYKSTSPDKTLKPESSFRNIDSRQLNSTFTNNLQSIQPEKNTINISHNREESVNKVPTIEKVNQPVNVDSKKLEDNKLNVEIPKQDTSPGLIDIHPVTKEDSEQQIEPKLKRIKFSSSVPLGPIRTYEKNSASKKDNTKSLTNIKDASSSTTSVPSSKEEKRDQIPRPPNAFMIFANEWRKKLSVEHPDENNKDISIRLGNLWKSLSLETKDNYYEEAAKILQEHKAKYPDSLPAPKKVVITQKTVRIRKSLPGPDSGETLSEGSLEVISCDLEGSDSNSRDTIHSSTSA